MKIVFLGATRFSDEMLHCLQANRFNIQAVFMIPSEFSLKKKGEESSKGYENFNFADLAETAKKYNIPCYTVDAKKGRTLSSYSEVIRRIRPDIILVLGWYYIVPKSIRELAVQGACGIHASLLPEYAGGSPLVWAMIRGESKTGITVFRLEDGVDDGDIFAQEEIEISISDTIGTLYDKVTEASKKMLVAELRKIESNTHKLIPQDKTRIRPFPIRTPKDGLINWNLNDLELYNFVRAQTKPYPCAYSFLESTKVKFVSMPYPVRVEYPGINNHENGEIIRIDFVIYVKLSNNLVRIGTVEVAGCEISFGDYCQLNNIIGRKFQDI